MMKNIVYFIACISFLTVISSSLPLYAQLDSASPWPMFRYDLSHTGKSSLLGPLPTGLQLKWSYAAEAGFRSSPAVGSDGRVYVGNDDYRFYCLSSAGALVWSYLSDDYFTASPAIDVNGRIYTGDDAYYLYCLNSNGSLIWSYRSGNKFIASPAVGADGKVYVGSRDNRLYGLLSDGSLLWSYKTGRYVYSSPAIGSDGRIYSGSEDDRLYCVNSNGTLSWSYQTGGDIDYSSPAIGTGDRIYIGSEDNSLYCLNSNGTLSWSYETGGEIERSSSAIDSAETVFVGSDDNNTYRLSSDGALSWSYKTGSNIKSSPAIGHGGTLYIGSNDNNVYALIADTPTPTPSPTSTSSPIATLIPNYVNLSASPTSVSPGGTVEMSWQCDFIQWNYQSVPVNVYLAAIKDPKVIDAPSSVADALGGGMVFLAADRMREWYQYQGSVKEPTWSSVAFPPVPMSGSTSLPVPTNLGLAGDWIFATAFVRRDTGGFVRTDGLPVENSNAFTIQ
jgi:outer membrane protein assembly factor BamB